MTVRLAGYKAAVSAQVTCSYGGACSPTLTLVANPPFAGVLTILPASITAASLAVTAPAGVGAVTLTADTSGALTWQQAGMPLNVVQPGNYTIKAALAGYEFVFNHAVVTSVPFSCTDSTCVFPSITLTAPTDLVVNLVSSGAGTPNVAKLALNRGATVIGSPATTTGTATFSGQSTADPSIYTLSAHAAGFTFADNLGASSTSVSCINGATTVPGLQPIPGGTTTCTVTLDPLGVLTMQSRWDMQDLTGAHLGFSNLPSVPVTAQLLDSGGNPTGHLFPGTTSAGSGALTLTGSTADQGLSAGVWRVIANPAGTGHLTGYETRTGTVQIVDTAGVFTMQQDTGATAWTVDTTDPQHPVLQLDLQSPAVTVRIHLQSAAHAGTDIAPLPQVTVHLVDQAGTPNSLDCTTVTPLPTQPCTVSDVSGARYVQFTNVPPGSYSATVLSVDGVYGTFGPSPLQILPADGPLQSKTFQLTPLVSTLTGAVVDPNHAAISGATVQLWPWQGTAPATDFNGDPFAPATTDSGGIFNFTLIKDGNYQLVVDAPGYARVISGIIPVHYPTLVPPQTIATTTPSTRNTTLTFSSPVSGASLSGATVTLTPVPGTSLRNPDNTIQSGIAITGNGGAQPWTATIPQLPTGQWKVTILGQGGSQFPVPAIADLTDPTADTFTVPEDTDKGHPQPLTGALHLNEARVSISLGWTAVLCAALPTGTIPITVTKSGVVTPLPVTLTVNAGQTAATGSAILPPGSYTWNTTSPPAGWRAPASDVAFTVAAQAAAKTSSGSLTPITSTVTVDLTVDGSPASSVYDGSTVTPTCGTTDGTAADIASGTVDLTLANGTWSFSIAAPDANHPVFIDDKTNVAVNGDATVTFAGHTLQARVGLDSPTGRPTDTRNVAVRVFPGATASGTAVFSHTTSLGATTYTSPVLLLGGTQYSVSATPPATDVFDPDSNLAINVTSTHTTTLTLPYNAAMVAVTAEVNGAAQNGVSLTITPAGNPGNPVSTSGGGKATVYDLDPNSDYDIAATYTDTAPTPDVHYVGSATFTTGDADTSTPVTITLAPVPGIVATVVDSSSDPVATASARLFTATGTQVGSAVTTDSNGIVRLGPLSTNTDYYLLVTKGSQISPYTLVHTSSSATTITTAQVTLGATASLSLTATVAGTGKPASITVTVHGRQLFTSPPTAANDGTLTVSGLPPNTALTVAGTWTDTTPNPDVTYTGTTSATTGAPGSTTSGVSVVMTP